MKWPDNGFPRHIISFGADVPSQIHFARKKFLSASETGLWKIEMEETEVGHQAVCFLALSATSQPHCNQDREGLYSLTCFFFFLYVNLNIIMGKCSCLCSTGEQTPTFKLLFLTIHYPLRSTLCTCSYSNSVNNLCAWFHSHRSGNRKKLLNKDSCC